MYFSEFPLRYYNLGSVRYLVPDIIHRLKFKAEAKTGISAFVDYVIKDGETSRKISSLIYENADYDWVILLFNGIYDVYEQWPMESNVLKEYIIDKYGISNIHNLHHYVNSDGDIVGSNYPTYDRKDVSNYEHEEEVNDNKRNIKLINPEYIPDVLAEFKSLIK